MWHTNHWKICQVHFPLPKNHPRIRCISGLKNFAQSTCLPELKIWRQRPLRSVYIAGKGIPGQIGPSICSNSTTQRLVDEAKPGLWIDFGTAKVHFDRYQDVFFQLDRSAGSLCDSWRINQAHQLERESSVHLDPQYPKYKSGTRQQRLSCNQAVVFHLETSQWCASLQLYCLMVKLDCATCLTWGRSPTLAISDENPQNPSPKKITAKINSCEKGNFSILPQIFFSCRQCSTDQQRPTHTARH